MKASAILAALGLSLSTLAIPAKAADTSPIRVGAVLSTTGPAAFIGVPQQRILRDQIEAINKAGGLHGRPIKLTIYDTEGNTTKTVQNIRRLAESDKVDIIFGPGTSGEAISAIGVVNELKVPMLAFAASTKITDPSTRYVFQTAPSDKIGVPALLGFLQKRKIAKIGLLTTADGYGQSGSELIKALAGKYGISVVATEEMNRQDTDTTAQVLRMRQANVDAMVVWVSPPAAQVVLRNAKALNLNKPIFNSYAAATQDVLAQAGAAAEGTFVISQRLGTTPESLPASDRFKPLITKVSNDYSARYKELPTQFGGLAYDALLVLDKAVASIKGPINRESLRDAIESVEFDGTNGHFKFTATNHNGLDESSESIIEMVGRQGKWAVTGN